MAMMLSGNARRLNFFLKYVIKPLQAVMPMNSGVMRGLRKATEAGSKLRNQLAPMPRTVSVQNVDAGGVSGEWVIDGEGAHPDKAILYLHGGGYFFCSPATHRPLTWRLARETQTRVLSLDYRMVPEHTIDDCCEDAVSAYRWLLDQGVAAGSIVIGGDSAGGGLTLLTLLALRDRDIALPAAAFCLSPFADMSQNSPTLVSNAASSHMFHPRTIKRVEAYLSAGRDPYDSAISPAFGDYKGLPPLFIQVADSELLFNDSVQTAENAQKAGVSVEMKIWHNLPHVFTLFSDILPEGKKGIREIAVFVNRHLS